LKLGDPLLCTHFNPEGDCEFCRDGLTYILHTDNIKYGHNLTGRTKKNNRLCGVLFAVWAGLAGVLVVKDKLKGLMRWT
jgi:hypothetical protein